MANLDALINIYYRDRHSDNFLIPVSSVYYDLIDADCGDIMRFFYLLR